MLPVRVGNRTIRSDERKLDGRRTRRMTAHRASNRSAVADATGNIDLKQVSGSLTINVHDEDDLQPLCRESLARKTAASTWKWRRAT